jgi:RNA polymerase sigma-70 factor (ECF subfamily)
MGELLKLERNAAAQPAEPEDLIEACRRGERSALSAVFRAHAPYLERLLARVVGPGAELEDVLQATFLGAISAFPRFRGEAQVRTWLARIAIRTAHERLRRAEHRRRGELPPIERIADDAEQVLRGEHGVDTRRQLERLYHHLDALGPKKRLAFVLHVLDGHPLEDVAALTGASVAATKSRVFWARRELFRRAARDPLLRGLLDGEARR